MTLKLAATGQRCEREPIASRRHACTRPVLGSTRLTKRRLSTSYRLSYRSSKLSSTHVAPAAIACLTVLSARTSCSSPRSSGNSLPTSTTASRRPAAAGAAAARAAAGVERAAAARDEAAAEEQRERDAVAREKHQVARRVVGERRAHERESARRRPRGGRAAEALGAEDAGHARGDVAAAAGCA